MKPVPGSGVVRLLLAVDLALLLLYILNRIAGPASDFLAHFLDLDGEANLPAWASSLQLAGSGVLLLLAWWRQPPTSPSRRGLVALGLLFLLLSLDETASIHEWLGHFIDRVLPGGTRIGTVLARTGIWMFGLVPLVAAWVWWSARPLWHTVLRPADVRRPGLAGLTLFFGSAGAMELLSNFTTRGNAADALQVVLEEGGELLGVTLLLQASYNLWRGPGGSGPHPTTVLDK